MYKLNYNPNNKKFTLTDSETIVRYNFYFVDFANCFKKYKRYTIEYLIGSDLIRRIRDIK